MMSELERHVMLVKKDIAEADREYHKQCIVRSGVLNTVVNSVKQDYKSKPEQTL